MDAMSANLPTRNNVDRINSTLSHNGMTKSGVSRAKLPSSEGVSSSVLAKAIPDSGNSSRVAQFDSLVRGSMEKQSSLAQTKEQKIRELANQLVSVTFIKPMLAQASESPFRSELFHGGHGEKMFQEHLDSVIADRIATRSQFDIGRAVFDKLMDTRTLSGQYPQTSSVPHPANVHGADNALASMSLPPAGKANSGTIDLNG